MQTTNKTPIVKTGQGDFEVEHFCDEQEKADGDAVGLMLVVMAYFVAGIVVGAWLF